MIGEVVILDEMMIYNTYADVLRKMDIKHRVCWANMDDHVNHYLGYCNGTYTQHDVIDGLLDATIRLLNCTSDIASTIIKMMCCELSYCIDTHIGGRLHYSQYTIERVDSAVYIVKVAQTQQYQDIVTYLEKHIGKDTVSQQHFVKLCALWWSNNTHLIGDD